MKSIGKSIIRRGYTKAISPGLCNWMAGTTPKALPWTEKNTLPWRFSWLPRAGVKDCLYFFSLLMLAGMYRIY